MIQERSILKVVPQISERRSLRIDLRGSRSVRDRDLVPKPGFGDKRDRANCIRSLHSRTVAGLIIL